MVYFQALRMKQVILLKCFINTVPRGHFTVATEVLGNVWFYFLYLFPITFIFWKLLSAALVPPLTSYFMKSPLIESPALPML